MLTCNITCYCFQPNKKSLQNDTCIFNISQATFTCTSVASQAPSRYPFETVLCLSQERPPHKVWRHLEVLLQNDHSAGSGEEVPHLGERLPVVLPDPQSRVVIVTCLRSEGGAGGSLVGPFRSGAGAPNR